MWSLSYDGDVTVKNIRVQAAPAYNCADGDHVDENGESFRAQNKVIGLLFLIKDRPVYFASDTDFLYKHEELTVNVDVFIPLIGGHFTMDRHEVADFVENAHPQLVLPVL